MNEANNNKPTGGYRPSPDQPIDKTGHIPIMGAVASLR